MQTLQIKEEEFQGFLRAQGQINMKGLHLLTHLFLENVDTMWVDRNPREGQQTEMSARIPSSYLRLRPVQFLAPSPSLPFRQINAEYLCLMQWLE
jgi:hypothetical protein